MTGRPLSKQDQAGRTPPPSRRLAWGSSLAAPEQEMAKFSEKRAALYRESYLPARKRFLKERDRCEARVKGICTRLSEDVHHMVQRSLAPGEANLMDESMWLPVCRACHDFISDDSTRARAMGLEISPKEVERD